jgi:hypothetical protein
MREADFLLHAGQILSATIRTPRRAASIDRQALLVGWDTEFRPEDGSLLSVQFSVLVPSSVVCHSQSVPCAWAASPPVWQRLGGHSASCDTGLVPACAPTRSSCRRPSYGRRFRLGGRVFCEGELFSRVYYAAKPRLSADDLGNYLEQFLLDAGVTPPGRGRNRRVYLVAHFAQAELGTLEDPIRDVCIRQYGKAHHGRLRPLKNHDGTIWDIRLVDLYAFYAVSLEKIGAYIGLPKVHSERTQLEALLQSDRAAFERYAARDAEIALVAFDRLRQSLLQQWRIDILHKPTLPSVASDIFRRHFLSVPPSPAQTASQAVSRRTGAGYRRGRRQVAVYSGPADVRLLAGRAYWGGRVEAYLRGLVQQPVAEWDAVSLYPYAAVLQPLPNARTRWLHVESVVQLEALEGFGIFRFRFPKGTVYPCLPTVRPGVDRLLFPLQGTTSCTFSEIRAATRMGARIEIVSAWGFAPSEGERSHDVQRYVEHFIALKKEAAKGSLEYTTAKLLLNALVGKFGEKRQDDELLSLERAARWENIEGVGGILARSTSTRDGLRSAPAVGTLFAIEWATLIVGRARALMAELIAKGALLVSTDAVILPASLSLDCPALDALRSVGSDMALEVQADAVFIARSRMYALLRRADNVARDAKVLARNETWAVIKVARHGAAESETAFAELVLRCLRSARDEAVPVSRTRLLTARAAVRESRPGAPHRINEPVMREATTSFAWDGKRRLADRDVNPFRSASPTRPYLSIETCDGGDHQRQVLDGEVRRRRRAESRLRYAKVIALLYEGKSVRETARMSGVPRSTVSDLKKALESGNVSLSTEGQVDTARAVCK